MVNGIKVKKVINEPSAAVLSYGFPKKFYEKNRNKIIINKKENDEIIHPLEEIFLNQKNQEQI